MLVPRLPLSPKIKPRDLGAPLKETLNGDSCAGDSIEIDERAQEEEEEGQEEEIVISASDRGDDEASTLCECAIESRLRGTKIVSFWWQDEHVDVVDEHHCDAAEDSCVEGEGGDVSGVRPRHSVLQESYFQSSE